jgi:hypothetical protein
MVPPMKARTEKAKKEASKIGFSFFFLDNCGMGI